MGVSHTIVFLVLSSKGVCPIQSCYRHSYTYPCPRCYRLAETCEYGDMTSQMIRDWLVVGIQNLKPSEQLQMDPNLTLEIEKS